MTQRLLYVDVNASFMNPTRNLLPLAMMQAADVVFFGPGHVASDELAKGLPAFIDRHGPFDAVASNTLVLFSDSADPSHYAASLRKAYAYEGPPDDLFYLPIIAKQFAGLSLKRLVILLENDFYNWTARERDKIDASGDVFIGFGEEFSPFVETMPYLREEKFAGITTDVWAEFCRKEKSRIASLPHFICDTEIDLVPLALRRQAWSVMGVQYHARGVARDHLVKNGIEPVTDSRLRKGVSLLKKLRLMRREKRFMQRLLNADFAARIASTRFSYTCGSALRMPIRKFFEIPAAGSVLVCRPFEGFSDAGYRDGVNAVIAEPDTLIDVHQSLMADPDKAQRIARAGQRLVMDGHSLSARARDLSSILDAVAGKRFHGSYWHDGSHQLREAVSP
jgi:Glycosyl transferases group 1